MHEAQAKEVIEAWVSGGYSLRYMLVEVLISSHNNDYKPNELKELLEKISHLLSTVNEGNKSVKVLQGTLPETFVGSISKSMKSGIRME
jgi:hypothetical protein